MEMMCFNPWIKKYRSQESDKPFETLRSPSWPLIMSLMGQREAAFVLLQTDIFKVHK